MKSITLILAALTLALAGPATAAQTPPTHDFTLENGLRVLVREDHRAPVAVLMVWYKVGSFDEAPGETGLAHVLEHMMFRGSERFPNFDEIVNGIGAESNAYTTDDYTAYHLSFASEDLATIIELEADRFQNLAYSEAQVLGGDIVLEVDKRFRLARVTIRGQFLLRDAGACAVVCNLKARRARFATK